MRSDVNKLFEELGSLSQVEAVALGGSRATGRNDEKSAVFSASSNILPSQTNTAPKVSKPFLPALIANS